MVSAPGTGPLGQGVRLAVHLTKPTNDLDGDVGAFEYQRAGLAVVDALEVARATAALQRSVRPYYDPDADQAAQKAYYRGIEPGDDPGVFFDLLSTTLSRSHTRHLEYGEARYDYLYPWVDLHPEDLKLHGVYTDEVFDPKTVIEQDRATDRKIAMLVRMGASVGGALSDALLAAKYNTEHSVPQTWFDRKEPMRGDLHCLFTANIECNSLRGSLPFGEVSVGGSCSSGWCGQENGRVFEPERNKGAVARATLYFLMRYPGLVEANEMPRSTIATLIKWHTEEPPSLWEKHRNAEIAHVQGNRNPLIDHPEWATQIDFLRGYGS